MSSSCLSQTRINGDGISSDSLKANFINDEVNISKGEIISNAIKINNVSKQVIQIGVELNFPAKWTYLNKGNVLYEINPGDSIFIPIRVIPRGLVNGNTKFTINAYIKSKEGRNLKNIFFYAAMEKHVSWKMDVFPESNIYFRNGNDTASFTVDFFNDGNYEQEILFTIKTSRQDLLIRDTANNVVNDPNYTFALQPLADTSFSFSVKPLLRQRNFKTVSLNNHKPFISQDQRVYTIFLNSKEPKQNPTNKYSRGTKVNFKQLANEQKATHYNGPILPIIVEANVQNVMGSSAFLSLSFRGFKEFEDKSYLSYFSQFNFSSIFIGTDAFVNSSQYLGYFRERYNIEIGQISAGVVGTQTFGRGVKASVLLHPTQRISGYYIRAPKLFGEKRNEGYGLIYTTYLPKNNRLILQYAKSINIPRQTITNVVALRGMFRIFKNHNIGILGAYSSIRDNRFDVDKSGYLVGLNYSSTIFKRRLNVNLNGRYNNKTFTFANNERLLANARIKIKVTDRFQLFVTNNYNRNTQFFEPDTIAPSEFIISINRLDFMIQTDRGGMQPFIYYNLTNQFGNRLHSRGVGFRYGNFDLKQNILFSVAVRGGYDKALDIPGLKDYFTFQLNTLARIRTWNFNVRYLYGPSSLGGAADLLQDNITPQLLRLSVQYQYLFKNTRFVFQPGSNYTYNNRFKNHNFGLFAELYYFTTTGWRISINGNYNLSSNNFQNTFNEFDNQDSERNVASNGIIGASVRKEFGLPIPFAKKRNFSLDFMAFYDLDGNKVRDKGEPLLENIVVRVDNHEVVTNIMGEAKLLNVPMGQHPIILIPLENLNGWFPYLNDSILVDKNKTVYLPFVRGVKVYGEVVLEREALSAKADEPFDLSNIKISAFNGKTFHTLTDFDGGFRFYLPNGSYTITLDEGVLGEKYSLSQNNIKIELDNELESLYVSFFITERKRKVTIKKFGTSINEGASEQDEPIIIRSQKVELKPVETIEEVYEEIIELEDSLPIEIEEQIIVDTIGTSIQEEINESELQEQLNVEVEYLDVPLIYGDSIIKIPAVVDKTTVRYRLEIASFREMTSEEIDQVIAFGYELLDDSNPFAIKFISGKQLNTLFQQYKNQEKELRALGVKYSRPIGDYKGNYISTDNASKLLEQD